MVEYCTFGIKDAESWFTKAGVQKVKSLWQFQNFECAKKVEILQNFSHLEFSMYIDRGSYHKNANIQNLAVQVGLVDLLELHILVCNRNAPDGSWVNSVEHMTMLLKLSLQHHG